MLSALIRTNTVAGPSVITMCGYVANFPISKMIF